MTHKKTERTVPGFELWFMLLSTPKKKKKNPQKNVHRLIVWSLEQKIAKVRQHVTSKRMEGITLEDRVSLRTVVLGRPLS